MENQRIYNNLSGFIEDKLTHGYYYFTFEDVKKCFDSSVEAIKMALLRHSGKGRIHSVHKGFYVIIPPEYSSMGMLPTVMFINDLMNYLNRPYYIGLLSAAVLHGAAHQKPQESFVITTGLSLRPTVAKGIKVNYSIKSQFPQSGIIEKKSVTGYFKVSGPELTAIDLIRFEKQIGGLSRAATVLAELSEVINNSILKKIALEYSSIASIQRLGYIMDKIIQQSRLADSLQKALKGKKLFRVPLKASGKKAGFAVDSRWNIIINTQIASDI